MIFFLIIWFHALFLLLFIFIFLTVDDFDLHLHLIGLVWLNDTNLKGIMLLIRWLCSNCSGAAAAGRVQRAQADGHGSSSLGTYGFSYTRQCRPPNVQTRSRSVEVQYYGFPWKRCCYACFWMSFRFFVARVLTWLACIWRVLEVIGFV